MLVGIIIGIVVWQIVVGIIEWVDPFWDETWIICPLFNILIWGVEQLINILTLVRNYRVYIFLISLGINPWRAKLSDLQALTLEQKEKIVEYARGSFKQKLEFALFRKRTFYSEKMK